MDQLKVFSLLGNQLAMRASLYNFPLIKYTDQIRPLNTRQSMHHRNRGAVLRRNVQRRL